MEDNTLVSQHMKNLTISKEKNDNCYYIRKKQFIVIQYIFLARS